MRNIVLLLTLVTMMSGCSALPDPTGFAASSSKSDLKLYVFDCGGLTFEDVSAFGLTNEETDVREMFVPCYLVDNGGRLLFWDGGLPLGIAGQGEVELDSGGIMRYERSVLEQLADLGLTPADVEFTAFSHFHFDHVGAANAFTTSTLLIQETEYTAAFEHPDENPVFDPSLYGQLTTTPRILLDGDHDVFGDGRVIIYSAPGHTPGHQVLWLDLANEGPLMLSGDLYHFVVSRQLRRVPVFNTDKAQTLASMTRVEEILNSTGAALWIEHNKALADTLRKAPAYYD